MNSSLPVALPPGCSTSSGSGTIAAAVLAAQLDTSGMLSRSASRLSAEAGAGPSPTLCGVVAAAVASTVPDPAAEDGDGGEGGDGDDGVTRGASLADGVGMLRVASGAAAATTASLPSSSWQLRGGSAQLHQPHQVSGWGTFCPLQFEACVPCLLAMA